MAIIRLTISKGTVPNVSTSTAADNCSENKCTGATSGPTRLNNDKAQHSSLFRYVPSPQNYALPKLYLPLARISRAEEAMFIVCALSFRSYSHTVLRVTLFHSRYIQLPPLRDGNGQSLAIPSTVELSPNGQPSGPSIRHCTVTVCSPKTKVA